MAESCGSQCSNSLKGVEYAYSNSNHNLVTSPPPYETLQSAPIDSSFLFVNSSKFVEPQCQFALE